MYTKGQRVAIINKTYSGKFIVEGYATVRSHPSGDDFYNVRFEGEDSESQVYQRFIDPAAQADPVGYCIKLNTFTTV